MVELAELEARIRHLENIEAIKQLKAKYWRCIDKKLWDELAECFTEDATADYGEYGISTGKAKIIKALKTGLGEKSTDTFHQGQSLEIQKMTATRIKAVWRIHDYLLFEEPIHKSIRGYGFYEDEYILEKGYWKIKITKLVRIFGEIMERKLS
jgi:bile-acid 7alpha-dehydratase